MAMAPYLLCYFNFYMGQMFFKFIYDYLFSPFCKDNFNNRVDFEHTLFIMVCLGFICSIPHQTADDQGENGESQQLLQKLLGPCFTVWLVG
jgi:hypothetical protein